MTGATTADENIRLIELYEASFSQVGRADFGGDGIIAWLARTCQSQSNWLDTFSHGWAIMIWIQRVWLGTGGLPVCVADEVGFPDIGRESSCE